MSVRTPVANGITFWATLETTSANIPSAVAPRYRERYGSNPTRFFQEEVFAVFLAAELAPIVAAAALIGAPTLPWITTVFPAGNVRTCGQAIDSVLSRDSRRSR